MFGSITCCVFAPDVLRCGSLEGSLDYLTDCSRLSGLGSTKKYKITMEELPK